MRYQELHPWNIAPKEAVKAQRGITRLNRLQRLDRTGVRTVAGIDVSVKDGSIQAAAVVLSFPELEEITTVRARRDVLFPYVPGLLSFREGPVILDCMNKLDIEPDVLMFDGQGTAHPRRAGLAVHMGVILQRPSLGCAKSILCGKYKPPGNEKGLHTPILHKGENIGAAVRTRKNVRPVFVSPGHLCDTRSAVELVLRCTTSYKLPQPIRLAHKACALGEN